MWQCDTGFTIINHQGSECVHGKQMTIILLQLILIFCLFLLKDKPNQPVNISPFFCPLLPGAGFVLETAQRHFDPLKFLLEVHMLILSIITAFFAWSWKYYSEKRISNSPCSWVLEGPPSVNLKAWFVLKVVTTDFFQTFEPLSKVHLHLAEMNKNWWCKWKGFLTSFLLARTIQFFSYL